MSTVFIDQCEVFPDGHRFCIVEICDCNTRLCWDVRLELRELDSITFELVAIRASAHKELKELLVGRYGGSLLTLVSDGEGGFRFPTKEELRSPLVEQAKRDVVTWAKVFGVEPPEIVVVLK